jgi:branched-chain amino acid transport system permease protein
LQLIVNITVLAAIYALLACGYVLIYRVSRVMNMAHGELAMLGAYLLYTTASLFADHPVGAIGILLRGVVVLIWSAAQPHPLQALKFSNPSIELIGGARISTCAALMVLATVAVYAALFVFLRFGRWGMRLRAAGQNPLLAAQRGINLNAIYALAWALSTLTGSIAGMLIALDSGLDQTMVVIGLKAFAPALVGGLDSLLGALIGAVIVAAAEVFAIHYIDPLLSDVVPFLVLIAALIVRPWGLFGTREELDRV